jgi:hypothetical protein
MRKRIYIETTVVSYFASKPNRDLMVAGHQEATRKLWPKLTAEYEAYISALVYQEAERGEPDQAKTRRTAMKPFPMLDIDDEARLLAEKIIAGRDIPEEYPEDALHIAVAAVNGMDAVITWNFTHINNPFTRMASDRSSKTKDTGAPKSARPRNYWRLKNERPDCRGGAEAPLGAYPEIRRRTHSHLR